MSALTRLERETGILWNDEEKEALIWSTSPRQIRRFQKQFGPGRPKGTHCVEWIVELRQLTVRKKARRDPRILTEAQKNALKTHQKRPVSS